MLTGSRCEHGAGADPSAMVRARRLCLSDSGLMAQAAARLAGEAGETPSLLLAFRDLRRRPGLALRLLFRRWDAASAFLADARAPLYRDFIVAYLFALRARRRAVWGLAGEELPLSSREGLAALGRCLGDLVRGPLVYLAARRQAGRLLRARPTCRPASRARLVAYLRANLWQESQAGGAVAHTTGVLGGLTAAGMAVTYIGTAEFPPARRLGLPVAVVPPERMPVRNLPDLPFVAYGSAFTRRAGELLRGKDPGFIYQRYSLLNMSGASLARRLACPLVLEYNGSEVWIARHWSTPLLFEGLASRIEAANLTAADLIVVVSKALRDEVVGRGISPDRVLVNPNGVDPDRYHPGLDGSPIRARLGLVDRLVIGFVGTFGPWHGAEVLARAVKEVAGRLPAAHFLFVGDGSGMPRVREIVARDGVGDRVTFAGLVPQEEAPAYLAACDILASPHVPNPDGSPFFGSPTKLFEYMAMGKGIVASDLDQIGEILSHGETAWLVPPGDAAALAAGIVRMGEEPALCARLGAAARETAIRRHTWRAHVERLLGRMEELDLLEPPARRGPGGTA
jgi:glycosyltransferase involved in cell wall biosynthesis